MTLISTMYRATANSSDLIPNISTVRLENITKAWGGNDANFTGAPDWGLMLWNVVNVYPDAVGPIAWFILFSIPFIMMWLSYADMVPAAIVGIFFGIYVFTYVAAGSTTVMTIGIAMMVLAMVSMIWSMWQKRG